MNGIRVYTGTLTNLECGSCHIPFAIPTSMHDDMRDTGSATYCPNGHKISYSKTENQKLRDDLERAQRQKIWAQNRADRAEADADVERRSAIAYKGHLTRARKKIAAGVCPVAGCTRHFDNVQAHIATAHPGWKLIDPVTGEAATP